MFKMSTGDKSQDKTEFDQTKEKILAAIQRVHAAEAEDAQQEADCRRRYEAAKQEQKAALESGNIDQYRDAGLAAEAARLEIEFCEKRKKTERKPAANKDDDRTISSALSAEENKMKTEAINRIKPLLIEAASICGEAENRFKEINSLYASWKKMIMMEKDADYYPYTEVKAESSRLKFGMIENDIKAVINHIDMKGV